jgi:hypothetical protein
LNGAVICVAAASAPEGWASVWLSNASYNTVIWGAVKQTYSFESNGGTEYEDVYDYIIKSLPLPKKEGFRFAGWFDNPEFEGNPISSSVYVSSEKTTLYARWMTQEEYSAWCDGTAAYSAYILTFDEQMVIYGYSGWLIYTAEEDMHITVSFSDNNSIYTKKTYIYADDGSTLLTSGVSTSTIYCDLEIKAGETIYINVLPGYGSTLKVKVSEYNEW